MSLDPMRPPLFAPNADQGSEAPDSFPKNTPDIPLDQMQKKIDGLKKYGKK